MNWLFDTFEAVLIWGAVILTLGLVVYLACLQFLKMKQRRARRRRRVRRAMPPPNGPAREQRPTHNHLS